MRLITAREASEALGVALPRVYELARTKIIPFVRLGPKQIRFDQDELTAWAKRGGTNGNHRADARADDNRA